MTRRISPQRHGQSELLIRNDKQSSFTAINAISEGAMNIAFDPIAAGSNTFAGPGIFGKMFPNTTPFRPADAALSALAKAMAETGGDTPDSDHPDLPAGFTYLGQFIDHDITFDKTVGLPTIDDPATIQQARTPNLDLDSLYGFGPGSEVDGEMYEGSPGAEIFTLGRTRPGGADPDLPPGFLNDLNRRTAIDDKGAIIPDPRNDENLLVAQTHLAFLKFHNRIIAILPPTDGSGTSLFDRARQLVRFHYQWIVLHDFVKRLVRNDVFDDVMTHGRKNFRFEDVGDHKPFMPIEFSVAAYRLGHSMIRSVYDYNRVFNPSQIPATLGLLFRFSGPKGDVPIPSDWIIDWRRFFDVGDFGGVGDFMGINHARKIDTKIADPLKDLAAFKRVDNPPPSLSERNLLRGSRLGLPAGQDVAQVLGVSNPIQPAEIATGGTAAVVKENGFDQRTPLWFYILKEAEVRENGERLGEVGSRIVMEVFKGLLDGDENSFVNTSWSPKESELIPKKVPDHFTMADLLLFVNELSPIDGLAG